MGSMLSLPTFVVVIALVVVFWPQFAQPNLRKPKTPAGDHKNVDWSKAAKGAPRTGDQYLVIGVGFLGQRMVQRLLERGETKIRCFDVVPHNPFEGNKNVEYVIGNVLNRDDLKKALKGVDTVHSTFALIRFYERLEHQADISYNVNVNGTKNVLEIAEESGVKRLVYTSSSNVASLKGKSKAEALSMDENIEYISREESPNHYGWTKALAEEMALSFNRRQIDGGESQMAVSVIRPCSGIFGAFDKVLMEEVLSNKQSVIVSAWATMDYVYVDNVVLGHLLCEAKLQERVKAVEGQPFCISNNDPIRGEDLHSIIGHYYPEVKTVYTPLVLMSLLAHLSETVQKIGKGRVKLGKLDMLTPAMIATAELQHAYRSEKASKLLGYEPAFTLEEGIQQSIFDYKQKYPS